MTASSAVKEPFDRDRQFSAKRKSVILAAAQAFRRQGYHNTNMAAIADALDLTRPALYYYVKNKEEILFESHLIAYDAMDDILARPRGANQSGLDQLYDVFYAFVLLLTESGVSLLTDVGSLTGAWKSDVLKRRALIEDQVAKLVKRGQKDGSIRQSDPRMMVFFFMGALNWLNAWYDASGNMSGPEIAESFAQQMKNGLMSGQEN